MSVGLSRWRVRMGFVAGALVIFLARPTPRSLLYGLPLAVIGEAARLWAAGHIEKTQRLATGGPYAHSRNPLYLGTLLMAGGVAVAAASPWAVAGLVLYLAVFYPALIRSEAAFLRAKFGAAYDEWSRDVPLLLPRLTPGGPRLSRFEWQRVRSNREWRTALALPAVVALLCLRAWFP